MDIRTFLSENIVLLDGSMGSLLQTRVKEKGKCSETYNLTEPEIVTAIHKDYLEVGSNVICTNTFGINTLKYSEKEAQALISAAVENAKKAVLTSKGTQQKFIAMDIGPTGKLLKPIGDLDFEDAVSHFKTIIGIGAKAGVDLIFIETFNDQYETKAALLAAKEACDLPVFVSNAYSENGKLMSGSSPESVCAMAQGMGADAIGANCSFGPDKLKSVIEKLLKVSDIPVIMKPNAGLPEVIDGETKYNVGSDEFARCIAPLIDKGVRLVGGCCGTAPEYISKLNEVIKNKTPVKIEKKRITRVSSGLSYVEFKDKTVLIGERINPTGKKKLKEAILGGNMAYIKSLAFEQAEAGCDILDINMGVPGIDEKQFEVNTVKEIQAVLPHPLQIDSNDPTAIEAAARVYNGKPMINSVNGKEESMTAILPIAKKYGALLVALTLDENGIPSTADERIKIAERIIKKAAEYGIEKEDLIFDPLALTISSDPQSANITLETVKRINDELGCKTSLGVSNISFGMPGREELNSFFLTLAMQNGLSAAIMNPLSKKMSGAVKAFNALKGKDTNFADYLAFCSEEDNTPKENANESKIKTLKDFIVLGQKDEAAGETSVLLQSISSNDIIQNFIIPALNDVGALYESGKYFLPQLLLSAECAKVSFDVIKEKNAVKQSVSKPEFVIATVKGDIHDIGKNIVKLLVENYGFSVLDLGKDVDKAEIISACKKYGIKAVGLSALMTTTVPAMEETITELHREIPGCKVVVGGAVLSEGFAKKIGADAYAADAMATVRYLQSVL